MEQAFDVVRPDAERSIIFDSPSTEATVVASLVAGNVIHIDPASPENVTAPDGWRHVKTRAPAGALIDQGWLRVKFIGPAHQFEVPPVDEGEFVQRCARAEIQANTGGDEGTPAILADYLIALAWIESELTKFGNRLSGTSAIGPYQITQEEWAEFLAANPDSAYAPFQLYEALAQVAAAQYLTQRDWDVLKAEAITAGITEPGQEYVPSFLLLFQSRVIGARAAFALDQMHGSGKSQTLVVEALKSFYPTDSDRIALINRRRRFLQQGPAGGNTTVDEFVEKTSSVLTDAFKVGFSKLKTYFPEFAIPANPSGEAGTPWLATAQAEEALWADPNRNMSETSQPGKARIVQYFGATSYHPATVEPWCGAFVAWCMAQNGQPVVQDAAMAKSWKTWGTAELRKGGLTDSQVAALLPGAVVVLHPGKGTGTTGHVCLAINRMQNSEKLKCLGGNQSDTVRTDAFDLSRVASIRVQMQVQMPAAADDERLILARTIYGEARGESQIGKEAVAEVIMNRVASKRYPDTVKEVCLQPWQFSCWNPNDPNRTKIIALQPGGNADFDICLSVAAAAMAGQIDHLTDQVLHYCADYISAPSWVTKSPGAVMEKKIGRHLFYRGIK